MQLYSLVRLLHVLGDSFSSEDEVQKQTAEKIDTEFHFHKIQKTIKTDQHVD